MNTHETYVSLEVAKLLKQAGFDWEINDGYILYEDGGSFVTTFQSSHNFNGNNGKLFNNYLHHKEVLSRPTLSVAQKWLREVKLVTVEAESEKWFNRNQSEKCSFFWKYNIKSIDITSEETFHKISDIDNGLEFTTYESALEAGIKKCLTLILEK